MKSGMKWLQTSWPPLLVVFLFILGWQISVSLFGIEKWLLPSPADILREALSELPRLGMHTWATSQIALAGFLLSGTAGLVIACILHLIPGFKRGFYPLLILTQNIPIIALAPLLMIWFGYGLLPKMIVILLACFFPVVIATLDGFAQTDPSMYNYMNMIGANRRQLFFKLELPNALPYFFAGLKITAAYSVMGAVIAEWLGTDKGIGYYMLFAKSSFRTDRIFVALMVIFALSLVMFAAVLLLEKWLIKGRGARVRNQA
ncbi:ABC transporter permease [Brevibacillus fluminis]|uniref:ABC transporter permease n=1 Tax=Brevibacillus fluminis TaxID=511487 RepID=UPI003F8BF933